MPEGDSIYQLSYRLQPLRGRKVLKSDFRVPRYATVNLAGRVLTAIWPYGKNLFMRFNGADGETIVHTHLKMEGNWQVRPIEGRYLPHTARVAFELSRLPSDPPELSGVELIGHQLGFVRVFPASEYPAAIEELGPDVLARDFDAQEVLRRLRERPSRTIGQALLDQKVLAGVGNEFRAEICFLAGLHPASTVAAVDRAGKLEEVVDLARKLVWENRLSPLRVTTGVRKIGESTYVFGRDDAVCRVCGTPIEKARLQGDEGELTRIIWWCPNCQPIL